MIVLEVNDTGLRLTHEDGRSFEEPGVALPEGDGLLFGREARVQASAAAGALETRYWDTLSLDPMDPKATRPRSPADLAHLRGRVVGLVDSAVAGVASLDVPGRFLVLDGLLHGVVATEVTATDEVQRRATRVDRRIGLLGLQQVLARATGEALERELGLSVLGHEAREQVLNDLLPAVLHGLSEREGITVDFRDEESSTTVFLRRVDVAGALAEALAHLDLTSQQHTTAVVSHRLWPWLKVAGLVGSGMLRLSSEAVARSTLRHAEAIRGVPPLLCLVDKLIVDALDEDGEGEASPFPFPLPLLSQGRLATHVLVGSKAYALGRDWKFFDKEGRIAVREQPGVVGFALGDRGVLVQGIDDQARANGGLMRGQQSLNLGDRVNVGMLECVLIRVVPEGGERGA